MDKHIYLQGLRILPLSLAPTTTLPMTRKLDHLLEHKWEY